jgi:hypothetical protein
VELVVAPVLVAQMAQPTEVAAGVVLLVIRRRLVMAAQVL